MSVSRIEFLLKAYLQGVSTKQENEELFSMILEHKEYESLIEDGLLQYIKQAEGRDSLSAPAQNTILKKILRADAGILQKAPDKDDGGKNNVDKNNGGKNNVDKNNVDKNNGGKNDEGRNAGGKNGVNKADADGSVNVVNVVANGNVNVNSVNVGATGKVNSAGVDASGINIPAGRKIAGTARRIGATGRIIKVKWARYAAVLAVLLAGSAYLWLGGTNNEREQVTMQDKMDVAPGGNKAVLTLADGTTIVLDSTDNGVLAQQGGIRVIKLNSGALAYNTGKQGLISPKGTLLYNTISTPRGGQYQLVLADGTKVWMNAASSLRFPVAFTGSRRKVEISGEAYFEVAENKEKPFVVVADSVKVEVLGTSFNVNAYPDEESINTTLVEGAVRLNAGKNIKVLTPGQQARVEEKGQNMEIFNNVEVEGITAWRKGKFMFNETPIEKAMRQISRWYDVDVSYRGKVPEQTFNGVLSRDKSLSQILKVLEISQVHFKMEGKRVVVMP